MLFKKYFLIIVFFLFTTHSILANEELKNKIYKNVRCIVCQGQSIYESNSDFALDLKKLISKKIDAGESEKQIYDFLISRYGEWIVFTPRFNFNSLILWLLPLIVFAIGGFLIFRLNTHRKK
jgi:cytochrome c-type biogenesis protein CcmH